MSDANAHCWFGTDEPRPISTELKAGPLTAEFVDGALRAVRWHGQEVLRGVAYVVRDRDWGTIPLAVQNVDVYQDGSRFQVEYAAVCEGAQGATLSLRATIVGQPDGTLTFEVEAVADRDFETNRCGFCVLHPVVGVAGGPATVEHVDGTVRATRFPDTIEPWQPFKDLRAITHEVAPGLRATCRMEGDTFEMEDQRNWSDASYKTYVRPLALPWPYRVPAGVPQRQRVTLTINAETDEPPVEAVASIRMTLGDTQGRMPRIGLAIAPNEVDDLSRLAARLRAVGPQVLLLHFDPMAGHGGEAMRRLAAARSLLPGAEAVLECVLPGTGDPATELREIAAMVRDAGLALDAIAVSPSVDRQSTPPGSAWPDCPPLAEVYAAARSAFPGLRLGGGVFSYFTELNRKRPPVELLDFVTHCTCPIVHAADDVSVMQSLEALPFIVRSARGIIGDKPYRIGPSTIGMRQNPYGSRTFPNPDQGRLPMTHDDPRQRGLFAAAWLVGYVAETAEGNLDVLTVGALSGAFGLMPGDGRSVLPVYHPARGLVALGGAARIACTSTRPDQILGVAAWRDGRAVLWLANLTDAPQHVVLPKGFGRAVVFDQQTWPTAAGGNEPSAQPVPDSSLTLYPYAVARLYG